MGNPPWPPLSARSTRLPRGAAYREAEFFDAKRAGAQTRKQLS
jgi:hypothetical protein